MKTHIVDVINFGKLNLKKKQKAYWSEDPHHTWYKLNLEDEILVRGVECNIPEFWMFSMCEFSQKFKTFCLCATKFDPNLLASHLKSHINQIQI
jgi:predicted transcriptional regulator